MDRIENAISKGLFVDAINFCQNIELRPGSLPQQASGKFYSLYIVSLLIVGDIEEARYLWLRAPSNIKDSCADFSSLWNITVELRNVDMKGAHAAAKSAVFSPDIAILVEVLKERIRVDEVCDISDCRIYLRLTLYYHMLTRFSLLLIIS